MLVQARSFDGSAPEVAVVRAVPVALAQADAARDGAAELVVLMEIARVQAQPVKGGVVGVGNRRGLFSCDTEEALRLAVLDGVPVVKLAPRGEVLPAPHGLFLDGGSLSEDEACRVLAQCLDRFGALPKAQSAHPSHREVAAIQKHLKIFQQQLTLATRSRLAAR
jgi:hypothetical protein